MAPYFMGYEGRLEISNNESRLRKVMIVLRDDPTLIEDPIMQEKMMKSWGEHEGLLVEFKALAADSNWVWVIEANGCPQQ